MGLIVQDITPRKEMERVLVESEAKYRDLFEASPLAISINDLKGTITSVNKAWTELTGYTAEEVLGKSYSTITRETGGDEARVNMIMGRLEQLTKEDMIPHFNYSFKAKGGELRHVEVHVSLRKVEGVPVGIQIIINDIRDRRKLEDALGVHDEGQLQEAPHAVQ